MNNEVQTPEGQKNHLIPYIIVLIVLIIVTFLFGLYFGEIGLLKLFSQHESVPIMDCPKAQCETATDTTAKDIDSKSGATYQEGYDAALEFARNRVSIGGCKHLFSAMPHDSISGTIDSIDKDKIILSYKLSDFDIFNEDVGTKTVLLDEKTIIEEESSVPEEEIEEKMVEYENAMKEYRTFMDNNPEDEAPLPPTPPSHDNFKKININDLKVGDGIWVSTEINLTEAESFTATRIQLLLIDESVEQNFGEPPESPIEEPAEEIAEESVEEPVGLPVEELVE